MRQSILTTPLNAQTEQERRLEQIWLNSWKPLPAICTVNASKSAELLKKIELCQLAYESHLVSFRKTGQKRYSNAANRCQSLISIYTSLLSNALERVS